MHTDIWGGSNIGRSWSLLLVICLWQPCLQAFDQCEMTLSGFGVMRINSEDTATAAQVLSGSSIFLS